MKTVPITWRLLVVFALLFTAAVAARVLVPYFRDQQDEPQQSQSREAVDALLEAINGLAEKSPDHRFPSNMVEVMSVMSITPSQKEAMINRFVYLPPPTNMPPSDLGKRIILIEKLGHYKYREGGYGGKVGGVFPGWYGMKVYKAVTAENGLTIEQITDAHTR